MANFSKEFCETMVSEYTEALKRVVQGQSYSIGGRTLTRVNHTEILNGLKYWQEKLELARIGGKKIFCRRVIPHG